jgi:hypothetical protein
MQRLVVLVLICLVPRHLNDRIHDLRSFLTNWQSQRIHWSFKVPQVGFPRTVGVAPQQIRRSGEWRGFEAQVYSAYHDNF